MYDTVGYMMFKVFKFNIGTRYQITGLPKQECTPKIQFGNINIKEIRQCQIAIDPIQMLTRQHYLAPLNTQSKLIYR